MYASLTKSFVSFSKYFVFVVFTNKNIVTSEFSLNFFHTKTNATSHINMSLYMLKTIINVNEQESHRKNTTSAILYMGIHCTIVIRVTGTTLAASFSGHSVCLNHLPSLYITYH